MQKQRKMFGLGEAAKTAKPLKWHYLLSKYLSYVMQGATPQGTIHENNLPQLY